MVLVGRSFLGVFFGVFLGGDDVTDDFVCVEPPCFGSVAGGFLAAVGVFRFPAAFGGGSWGRGTRR